MPKNVKQGIFICKSLGEGFKEDRTETHLRYVIAEGLAHPFKRGEWFLNSAYAKQTDLSGGAETAQTSMTTSGESAW